MRIGIIALPLDRQYAGIHFYTQNLIAALSEINHDHTIFIIRDNPSNNLSGVEEVELPTRTALTGGTIRTLFLDIPKICKNLKLDVVIEPAHFGPFNLPKHIKRVTVIHDLTPLLFPKWHPRHSGMGHKLLMKRIANQADLLITNSEHTKSDIARHLHQNPNKIAVTPLGITDIWMPITAPQTLQDLGLMKPYLLFQGTIEPRKNIFNLIKAYDLYRTQNPKSKHQLVLSGIKGWGYRPILQAIKQSMFYKDIVLLGYVEAKNLPTLYSGADAFVYPSLYEGFGLPILEAMACGTPVVTSNISSMPEVGGEFAIYCDPLIPQSICSGISSALLFQEEHSRKQMTYAQQFTWKKTAKATLDAIKTIF